jgi:transposase InsO family protein
MSTSSYYYRPRVSRKERDERDAQLRDTIETIQAEMPAAGYRMIHDRLLLSGIRINGKRIRRVMNKYDLHAEIQRRIVRTTDSEHGLPVYQNLIRGLRVDNIDQVWVADITYIRIVTGFVFLAVILDVFSRRAIGWALTKRISHELTVAALKMALQNRQPLPGFIHHSDQGVQYACSEYVGILQEYGARISMSAKGRPEQNAYAETFFKTLKREEVYLWQYENFIDVLDRIPYFIEDVYNHKRPHSGINRIPPAQFEALLSSGAMENDVRQAYLILHGKRSKQ